MDALLSEADVWLDYRGKFQSLADEQRALLQGAREERRLSAYCEYNSDRTAEESDLISQGLVSLLYRFESGRWDVAWGPNEDFKVRFVTLATRAGRKLGSPKGTPPLHYWLHSLAVQLRRTDSKELFARDDQGGIIADACQSSATFCSRLEKRALETWSPAPAQEKAAVGAEWFESDHDIVRRRQLVLKNPRMPSKSLCKVFDNYEPPIPLPRDWRAELSVVNWSEAYENTTGRKRIQKIISTDRRAGA